MGEIIFIVWWYIGVNFRVMKLIVSVFLFCSCFIVFSQNETFKIVMKGSDAVKILERKDFFFRINQKTFEFNDSAVVCTTSSKTTIDTVFYRNSTSTEFTIYSICKFRKNEVYILTYNICTNEFDLKSNDTLDKVPSLRVKIKNYFEKNIIEVYTTCNIKEKRIDKFFGGYYKTMKGYSLCNDMFTEPIFLVNKCHVSCAIKPIKFVIRKRISKYKTEVPYIGYKDFKYDIVLNSMFLPLHHGVENLLLSFDYKTQKGFLALDE